MGGVDQQVDVFREQISGQALGPTKTANPNLTIQVTGHPANPGQAVDMLRAQGTGNGQCLGDATK
ncbi:hypothetical protein D3C84_847560 [compost metagenome]